jgi:kynurenine formamidase
VDTVDVQRMVAPACVIDCSAEAARDPDYLLTVADIERFEGMHGRIPAGHWVLMRTDWSKRTDPEQYQNYDETGQQYQNYDETGQHTPGPSTEAVRFLVEERDVLGFGSEAIGTDAGQGYHLKPPYPCHSLMHGAGKLGLQCLSQLDLLPPTGAVLVTPPLKILNGSGSPLRVLALVEGTETS